MIEYKRMSICSFSANLRAAIEGRTWNPTIMAFDAAASITSDSEICPTALCFTFTWISGASKFNQRVGQCFDRSVNVTLHNHVQFLEVTNCNTTSNFIERNVFLRPHTLFALQLLAFVGNLTCFTLIFEHIEFVASSAPFNPKIKAGHLVWPFGYADSAHWTWLAFMCPKYCPAKITSPSRGSVLNQNSCDISTSFIQARFNNGTGSSTIRIGFLSRAFRLPEVSSFSSNSFTPKPLLADMSCDWYFPTPLFNQIVHLRQTFLMASGLAPGLSILLIAKTIGTCAAAWLMASMVWGIILSSAAIMIIAMSVTWASTGTHSGKCFVTRRIEERYATSIGQ